MERIFWNIIVAIKRNPFSFAKTLRAYNPVLLIAAEWVDFRSFILGIEAG